MLGLSEGASQGTAAETGGCILLMSSGPDSLVFQFVGYRRGHLCWHCSQPLGGFSNSCA